MSYFIKLKIEFHFPILKIERDITKFRPLYSKAVLSTWNKCIWIFFIAPSSGTIWCCWVGDLLESCCTQKYFHQWILWRGKFLYLINAYCYVTSSFYILRALIFAGNEMHSVTFLADSPAKISFPEVAVYRIEFLISQLVLVDITRRSRTPWKSLRQNNVQLSFQS